MTKHVFDIEECRRFIRAQSPETKIYFGSDSSRYKRNGKWYADYATAIAIHINGRNGCRVFGEIITELDFDGRKDRPARRLMREVELVAEMFRKLIDDVGTRHCEVHCDINPDKRFGSSCVIENALAYLHGTCHEASVIHTKNLAPCASFVADRLSQILDEQRADRLAAA
jgi:predicted RNase H-related nuclease YkuK (DUF458 family)